MGQTIYRIGFLHQNVATVFFIPQDILDRFTRPRVIFDCPDFQRIELFCNFCRVHSLIKAHIDGTNNFSFVGNNHHFAIIVRIIAQQTRRTDFLRSGFHPASSCPLDISGDASGFLLCERSQHRQKYFCLFIQTIQAFLVKIHTDRWPEVPQQSNISQAVHHITSKTTDRLRKNQINFLSLCILYHLLKLHSMLNLCTRDSLIRINACQLPVWMLRYNSVEMCHLLFQTGFLHLLICADTTVCSDTLFRWFFCFRHDTHCCRNYFHIIGLCQARCLFSSLFLTSFYHNWPFSMTIACHISPSFHFFFLLQSCPCYSIIINVITWANTICRLSILLIIPHCGYLHNIHLHTQPV